MVENLLSLAKDLEKATDLKRCTVSSERKRDTYPGLKVDALFEDLSLPELEKRVQALKASVR
jgi:hypothetical protein